MGKAKKKKQVSPKNTEHQRTLGDQRQATRQGADGMKKTAQESDYPKITLLNFYVSQSFESAIPLVIYCKTNLDVQQLIQCYTNLDEYLKRAMELWDKNPELLQGWPGNPGITFAFEAGWSALQVAMNFSEAILNAVLYARTEALDIQHGKEGFADIVYYPQADPRILKWRDLTAQELNEKTLPPEWPLWKWRTESDSFRWVLSAEFEKARKEAMKNQEVLSVEYFLKKNCDYGHEDNIDSIKKAFKRVRDILKIEPRLKGSGRRPDKYTRSQYERIWAYGKEKLPPLKNQ